jgi:hypothetical protein
LNPWTTDHLGGLFFINSDIGFATSWDGYTKKLYKTLNGGFNWSLIYSSNTLFPYYFISLTNGYLCENYQVKRTINSGLNWFNITPDTGRQ